MKRCPYCDEEIRDNAIKCKHCGSTVSGKDLRDTLDGVDTISAASIGPGQLLAGRYRIEEKLGSGGMGQVWKALDTELSDMAVAIKVLPPMLAGNARSVEALRHEAAISLKLTHPHICRLHTFQSEGEVKFLVMECIEGRTLEQILAERADHKMTWEELKPIAQQIGEALDYAHGQRPPVLHRDIKPSNIMVTGEGEGKLLDFGVAREIRDSVTLLTGRQETSGTILYMSPEQFRGERLDGRSDVYSFCTVLYECLAGESFVKPGGSVAWQIQEKAFEPIGGVPDEANATLSRGLSKVPAARGKGTSALLWPKGTVRAVTADGSLGRWVEGEPTPEARPSPARIPAAGFSYLFSLRFVLAEAGWLMPILGVIIAVVQIALKPGRRAFISLVKAALVSSLFSFMAVVL